MMAQGLALFVLALCVILLLRLALNGRRQARFDAGSSRLIEAIRRFGMRVWHWRPRRRAAEQVAAQAAAKAIRRIQRQARDSVERKGNVYRPSAFRGPRKPH